MTKKVVVLPCSGVGKVYGTISREAAYKAVEQLKPEKTSITCLPLLVVGDEDAERMVQENPCIVINGCPSGCAELATKNAGGNVVQIIDVTKMLKENRDLKPNQMTIRELDPKGKRLAEIIAEKISREVDRILDSEEEGG
ncbi:MAG: putative zinc-binding protein [Candidatus Jordarchaeum sp.]|uniref:putative zinc-binding protein n=1 Tax=Candidatus Jordarchaeum sp. TaxID=2823881 RepID=UPI00404AF2F1